MENKVSKTWAFTLNNWTTEEEKQLKDLECNYIVFGYEKGKEGTKHLQGHIVFKKSMRLSALKKLNERAHWSNVISEESSANYCMKDKEYYLKDNRNQGTRNDLAAACKLVTEVGIVALKEEMPEVYVRYHGGFDKLVKYKKRDFKPIVTWIYGETGSGKTRMIVEKEKDLWISGKNLKWWQGYEGQEATLFDDFRADFCTFHELLRILDRYPYSIEVKGGHRELISKRMYITSCYRPEDIYNTREDINQLIRRIDEIIELNFVTEVE